MAQIEIIMYVALGFATAALIAVLLGGLVWNVAIGVGRRRAQRTAITPAVSELQAERNQLRADKAMLARRVELRLDDLKKEVVEHMAEVARSRNRIDWLGSEIARRDAMVAERDREIARLRDQVAGLEAELTTRTTNLHELQEEHGKGGQANATLSQQLAERDRHIERLRAEVDRLGAARSEAVSRERTVQERLKERIEDLSALSRQIEAQRRELVVRQSQSLALRETMTERQRVEWGGEWGEPDRVDTTAEEAREPTDGEQRPAVPLERRVEDAERQTSDLQNELDRLDEIWAAKLAEVARAVATEPAATEAGDDAVTSLSIAGPTGPHDAPALNGGAGTPPTPEADRAETTAEKPADEAVPAEEEKKAASGLANVISLAQRIRALQRNGS